MNWIDEIVLGLMDTYNTNTPQELCDSLGISITNVNPDNLLLSGNSSLYIRNYLDKEVIFIRNDLDIHFREFYLRHELGHAILHTKIFNTGLCNLGKLERQANYFAIKLSDIQLDEIELDELTLEQIACSIELPYEALRNII